MPRHSTFPTTYEERRSFSISDLRKLDYLTPESWKSGILSWSRNGIPRGSISISVCTYGSPYLQLSYALDKTKEVEYKVDMIKVPSNLGKGHVWYFRCPYTQMLCRKLYSIDGYFMHREAIKGYYEKQIQSKKYRELERLYGPIYVANKTFEETTKKYFKRWYKGQPTKRYRKILAIQAKAQGISEKDLINAFYN